MINVVLFDMDGVLLDSLDSHLKFCRDQAKKHNLDITIGSPQQFQDIVSSGVRVTPMDNFLRAYGFPEDKISDIIHDYTTIFPLEYPVKIFNGIPEMLVKLHMNDVILGLVTSNTMANAKNGLNAFLELMYSRAIITIDHGFGSKANGIIEAVNRINIPREEVLYIGDQPTDKEAAQKAGVNFLGVTYSYGLIEGVSAPRDITKFVLGNCE